MGGKMKPGATDCSSYSHGDYHASMIRKEKLERCLWDGNGKVSRCSSRQGKQNRIRFAVLVFHYKLAPIKFHYPPGNIDSRTKMSLPHKAGVLPYILSRSRKTEPSVHETSKTISLHSLCTR